MIWFRDIGEQVHVDLISILLVCKRMIILIFYWATCIFIHCMVNGFVIVLNCNEIMLALRLLSYTFLLLSSHRICESVLIIERKIGNSTKIQLSVDGKLSFDWIWDLRKICKVLNLFEQRKHLILVLMMVGFLLFESLDVRCSVLSWSMWYHVSISFVP